MSKKVNKQDLDFYQKYKLKPVLNAAGTMTSIGASRIGPEAVNAIEEIANKFVIIDELQAHASKVIAKATGGKGGFITSCSAAGVSMAVAACMTKDDLSRIEKLPDVSGMKSIVVMQKGHNVNYGAIIDQAVRLTGATVFEIGGATETNVYQLEGALKANKNIVAALFVQSHHCALENMISLKEFCSICKKYNVPVIADMASEYDLRVIKTFGVDIAIYSTHKFIGGTTGGILAAKTLNLVRNAYYQNKGIARTMKIGKENIIGAIAAINAWLKRNHKKDQKIYQDNINIWQQGLKDIKGINLEVIHDWTNNPIDRLRIIVNPKLTKIYAWELASRLRTEGKYSIYVREQFIEKQKIDLDPCNLTFDESKILVESIKVIIKNAQTKKNACKLSWDKYKRFNSSLNTTWPN